MSVWKLGLTDLQGVAIGEVLNAYDRTLSLQHNGLPTASFRIRLDNPLADQILSRNGDCLVKVYQDSTLRFIGDITNCEEVGDAEKQSLAVNAAGPLWRLQKRLIGAETAYSDSSADLIISALLQYANSQWDTGIRLITPDVLYNTSAGPWAWKPVAEAITEMQAVGIAFPIGSPPSASRISNDTFQQGGSPLLSTQSDLLGNPWVWAGDTTQDFTVVGGIAARSAVTALTRYAIPLLLVSNNTLTGVDWTPPAGAAAGYVLRGGLVSRFKGASGSVDGYIQGYIDVDLQQIIVSKNVGGAVTQLGSAPFAPTPVGGHSMRLLVDAVGNWQFWAWKFSDGLPGAVTLAGTDAHLMANGQLSADSPNDCNKCGFWDWKGSGPADGRDFDNFFISNLGSPQSFDFAFNPVEPVIDSQPTYPGNPSATPAGTVRKIAELEVRTQIGTSKPEVIFEYGTGGRSVKGYRRVVDRQGLANEAFSLPDTDVKYQLDLTSAAARGLYMEIVQSDLVDSRLRQALVDLHVLVRAIPRQIITFDPSETAPAYGSAANEYLVGDFVTGRAIVNGTVRFNALFRVYGVEISIDDNGKAEITPTLVPS